MFFRNGGPNGPLTHIQGVSVRVCTEPPFISFGIVCEVSYRASLNDRSFVLRLYALSPGGLSLAPCLRCTYDLLVPHLSEHQWIGNWYERPIRHATIVLIINGWGWQGLYRELVKLSVGFRIRCFLLLPSVSCRSLEALVHFLGYSGILNVYHSCSRVYKKSPRHECFYVNHQHCGFLLLYD